MIAAGRKSLLALAAAALLAAVAPRAHAEDIDIYAGTGGAGGTPNVIIALDNAANYDANVAGSPCYYNSNGVPTAVGSVDYVKLFGQQQCALYNAIDALPTGAGGVALFNVGVMLFGTGSDKTASVMIALTPMTSVNKVIMLQKIAGAVPANGGSATTFSIGGTKGNTSETAKLVEQAYLYLTAGTPMTGNSYPSAPWDPSAVNPATGRFVLPNGGSGCAKGYVIFIGNDGPGDNPTPNASAILQGLGGPSVLTPSITIAGGQSDYAPYVSRFMYSGSSTVAAPGIVTYGIGYINKKCDAVSCAPFYQQMATLGGGQYYTVTDSASLQTALTKFFTDIQAVSSVFASASLPVAVSSRGTYLNQVFLGMFLPDAQARPRWNGNLKQYQFNYDVNNVLTLVDSTGSPAISSSTGFITPTATSFWTTASSFWVNALAGTPLSTSDSPDGAIVAKGATAEVLRTTYAASQSGRSVFTCFSCGSGTTLGVATATQFVTGNTGNLSQAALGALSPVERDAIINWVRGTDNNVPTDEAGPTLGVAPTTVRPSLHGDVLHSRPAVISYGGSTGTVVFYGANDGMLHAVNGNQTGTGAGSELWSFVPQEFVGRLKRLRDNTPLVAFPTVPVSLSPTRRDYFVDGPISFYQHVDTGGTIDKVYLYVAMRRGGKLLYAFDVTTPTTPVFLWKKTQADIPALGQTWSEARVAKIKGNSNPVIVMGLGYDAAAEDQSPAGTATINGGLKVGAGVVVLDAFNGNVLQTFANADRSIPGDVSLLDTNGDGYIDRAYAADLGGNIYRIDFEVGSKYSNSDWTMTKLASLGSAGGTKLFYAPDVVLTKSYAVVLVGSGDREKPLATTSSDYFYTVIDRNLGFGMPPGWTPTTFGNLTNQANAGGGTYGCYLPLDTAGEKVVTSAVTVGGTTYFSTNEPIPASSNSCTANLGTAKAYAEPLVCQKSTATKTVILNGGGLPPSPVGGVVSVTKADGTTALVPFIIGSGTNNSAIQAAKVAPAVTPKRSRKYWIDESTQ